MYQQSKIALITNIMAPYRIPLFNHLAEQLRGELTVFFSDYSYQDREWKIPENSKFSYEIIGGPIISSTGRGFYDTRHIHLSPKIFFRLLSTRPGVVIAAEFSIPSFLGLLYCKLTGAKFISWSENTLRQERYASRAQRWIRRYIIRRSSACIGTSTAAMDKYRHYGCPADAIFLSIQAVDVDWFHQKASDIRKLDNNAAPSVPSIIYTGTLSTRKGVSHLLEAFKLVRGKLESRLILVGSGAEEDMLKEKAKGYNLSDSVEFVGFREGEAIVKQYSRANLFVLPSLEDTFGLVVNEAMACGLPVICSPFAGASDDLVVDGENGYIVDPTDHKLLAESILKILLNKEIQKQMGESSLSRISKFGIDAAVEGMVAAQNYVLD